MSVAAQIMPFSHHVFSLPSLSGPIFPLLHKAQPLHTKANKINSEWEALQNHIQNRSNSKPSNFIEAQNNRNKNRYPDILPYDKNRVVLTKPNNYINASKVSVGEKNFISCQAPLPQTFSDFWSMVWVCISLLSNKIKNS